MRLELIVAVAIMVIVATVAYAAVAYLARGGPSIDVPGAMVEVPYYPVYGFHTKDALRKLEAAFDPIGGVDSSVDAH